MGLFGLKLAMASTDALACTYAALILHDDGIPITDDKISAIIKAAGIEYEAYWPGLFATMLKDKNVEDLLMASASAGAAPAAAPRRLRHLPVVAVAVARRPPSRNPKMRTMTWACLSSTKLHLNFEEI